MKPYGLQDILSTFIPYMAQNEYELVMKHLTPEDTLLEWGSGNSTLYFSPYVNKIITIEHDALWVERTRRIIEAFEIPNIVSYHVPATSNSPLLCKYQRFKDYVEFPKTEELAFTKVLIDGRARKYCAKVAAELLGFGGIAIIHDFNRPDYHKVLKYFDVKEQITTGRGLAVLRKKDNVEINPEYY